MARTKGLLNRLTRRGPHRVLRGDLAFAGVPGEVHTPESGLGLPAVAFGHDWVTPVSGYTGLLEHLASWGIVAAAPATEKGLAPSVLNLSHDLGVALDIVCGVRLGPGKISVDPGKLAVAGHGFGGSAAVFAAAGLGARVRTAAAIFPTVTKPSVLGPASALKIPGVVFGAPDDPTSFTSTAIELAGAWDDATLRVVAKGRSRGLASGRRALKYLGLPSSDKRTQQAVRGLLTGYLLYTLAGDKTYREFADAEVELPKTTAPLPELAPVGPEEKFIALLRG
ncbi:dienelactone hydrolase family protein [Mycolicibacterium brumae]|uniref:Alpha/beta hydrolase n=1 Tax=Mycolicibacterium brumae TaxID=85968 RepID=A0A2G5PHS1_9MYCO|nr:hypothetical protein [Mycolicibacterium brumae]MCV7194477.1 hypothetical protein [Mycolicibacterium brumae]PIB77710.1 hypothetical protein CQY22_001895 [Mycolicibacterium brumae]RWA20086.1 hypothetical protein MBRU_15750 [Mycolicibacterium brumae DSM 44177]UWW10012.1 hypothetical protein L2Z93_003130 [Mycolicibacterium brumae]